ncbi:hypothetical protein BJF85_00965 [Saccharomonospora sp. CUA-673]|uniref:cysteine dioxygenase n=1 Tax=Saccharomonospora sp. CUA-673 TaxID=1904969 RepID=UPI0009612FC1|nr:cysteine dioxygenase family protein [Saccharomonospora sp. CUA-673]OLT47030.1 hypothetical protein BJF85_00965 [Saccharomonospora sp. CUA-673]
MSSPASTTAAGSTVDDSGVEVYAPVDGPVLRGLLYPRRRRWTASQLRELTTRATDLLRDELTGAARYVPDQRWWARLALTDGVELWLLTWLPGQHTEPHDHGGASGSFTVLSGELGESYRLPPDRVREADRTAGETVAFGPYYAHQVHNRSAAPAASVHAYSPPLLDTRTYASLADVPTPAGRDSGVQR